MNDRGNRRSWMAVYTKPRSEKKTAERLANRGVEVYCPLQVTIRQWSDRKKKVKVPVFPSYIFVRVAEAERMGVLEDPGVLNFVYWLGKPAVIRDEEMEMVRAFHDDENVGFIEVSDYRVGDPIDIRAGSFSGMKGSVTEVQKDTVTVLMESINTVLKVTFQKRYLDKI